MPFERFSIKIEGQEASDLYADIISLEVELDDEMASMMRMQLAILLGTDGAWTYLDDDRLSAWKKVEIEAGFDDGVEHVFTGYITHLMPYFDADVTQCVLEVWSMDGSALLDREEKLKDWTDKKDSDIASEIFQANGLSASVDDTQVVHEASVSTILQRETDMQFLRRLAARNGFECYVEGDTGYFKQPNLDATPQPTLAAHFGSETNLSYFSVEVNALSPTNVAMTLVDRMTKEVLEASAQTSQNTALGSTTGVSLNRPGMSPAQVFVGMDAATGNPEMTALCQGLFHRAEWFVTGEGQVDANHYGEVLKPRLPVTIKGVGENYSGVYYVNHVTHSFTADGYVQSFRVKRNAIGLSGSEDFEGGGGGLV